MWWAKQNTRWNTIDPGAQIRDWCWMGWFSLVAEPGSAVCEDGRVSRWAILLLDLTADIVFRTSA
jgi:hypothetical protein